ncbi:hypothetical protein FPSE_01932 [Fusarium pseudograminearum CS3096]|uniref:Uncharacterized protein n=1 Tax=Fusarium pseudograminearum (strain CS3096) TaxID=1028729 RepID=K3VRN8_FUSPC|nr:hypothetical protein FPSE_01932 [Fusarium pseudograminearum CS3096]EKJ77839.1 hypothetical protein FPSE_01932 [Fusarium pseudograminearum CS3096]
MNKGQGLESAVHTKSQVYGRASLFLVSGCKEALYRYVLESHSLVICVHTTISSLVGKGSN